MMEPKGLDYWRNRFHRKKKGWSITLVFLALTIGAAGYNYPVARTITESVYEEPFREAEHFCGAIGNIGRA